MVKRPTILFCGGGSVGHVAPAIAVADACKRLQPDIHIAFVTSSRVQEQQLVRKAAYEEHVIHAPKFPSMLSIWIVLFPILFPVAIIESIVMLFRIRPSVVFSKGGYVSVPLCLIAKLFRIPIVLHESDSTIGKGNRLISRMAAQVCHGFPLPSTMKNAIYTGNPVRRFLAEGSREEGFSLTKLRGGKPVLLVVGGSQGAQAINEAVIKQADRLLAICDIIHLTGEGKSSLAECQGYWSAQFVENELAHLFAIADIAVTRAGAGFLSELAFAKIPTIVIPLSGVAHDHQVHNAKTLLSAGAIDYLPQDHINDLHLHVGRLLHDEHRRKSLKQGLRSFFPEDADDRIARLLITHL